MSLQGRGCSLLDSFIVKEFFPKINSHTETLPHSVRLILDAAKFKSDFSEISNFMKTT